jgi:D-amino-acid dehydrogenase
MTLKKPRVAIIGGGAVGVTTAYELSRRGARVTLFEAERLGAGASFGNAGLLVPSYCTPLATRGNLIEGLRGIFGSRSAVEVKLEPSLRTLSWFIRFAISATPSVSQRGTEILSGLTQRSVALFANLLSRAPASISFEALGTIYVAKTETTFGELARLANRLASLGIVSHILNTTESREHEPLLSRSIAGGVWYPGDAKLQPLEYLKYVSSLAVDTGAEIRTERVTEILTKANSVHGIRTHQGTLDVDCVVVAAGVWSGHLTAPLNLRLPIIPAKGYSIDLILSPSPRAVMLFSERHVSTTPMLGNVRATTGLDFHAYDSTVSEARLTTIRESYREYLEGVTIIEETPGWSGLRPLTPDGLPIVGPSEKVRGLFFATGHGPLGITLAPVTAELVANAILDDSWTPASIAPSRFRL